MRLLKESNDALKSGALDEADALVTEALEMDAESYEAWVMRGKISHARGAFDDAVIAYERAVAIKGDHPAAFQGLNETTHAKGDVEGRFRALRALVDTQRASGKMDRYIEFLNQACDFAWSTNDWARAIEFYSELGRVEGLEESSRVEAVRRACEAALSARDARAVEAGEVAVQMLRSTTIASKGDEAIVRKLGARASHAVDDDVLKATLREWLTESAANVEFDPRTHAAEFNRLDARLAASLSSQVNCDFDVKECAREVLVEASALVDRWGEVAFDVVSDVALEIVAALELGLDCEEEGWDEVSESDDCTSAFNLLFQVAASKPNAISEGWRALRETRRSGAFAHSCRPGQPPRGEKGLLSTALRDEMISALNREDESKPSHACAVLGWLALAESMLVGGEHEHVHALHCAASAMKILRSDITTDALPQTSRRVMMVHADAMLRSGMFKPARAAFIVLEGPRAMRGLAMCAFNAHPPEYDEALRILSTAAEAYPNAPRVRIELGWLIMLTNPQRREEALEILEAACGARPDEVLAPTTPANASARLGIARWRSSIRPLKGPGSAHEALLIGAAGDSLYRAAAFAHLGLSCSAAGDNARARKCHIRALALDPAEPTSGPVVFADALSGEDEEGAAAICRAALAVDSRCSWAANRLAPLCARAGDHEGAVGALQVVLRISPSNITAWEALGASYNALGRHSAALKAFERAMELSNDAGEGCRSYAAAQSGHIHLTLGSSVEATECYDKAMSDGIDRVAVLFGSASAHAYYAKGALRWGAPGRAATSVRLAKHAILRVIELMGDDATATVWKLAGDIHHLAAKVNDPALGYDYDSMLAGRAKEARSATEAHERAFALQRDKSARLRDLLSSLCLEREIASLAGDLALANSLETKALACAMENARLEPGDPRVWFALANIDDPIVTDASRRFERKITALTRATALDPTFAEAWCAIGRLHLSNGNLSAASSALDRARIADPSSGEAWTVTAAAHCARGDINEGMGAFRMAAQLGAGFEADLGRALTACASGLAHARDAYASARRACEAAPADASATLCLALCSESRGLYFEAQAACKRAAELADCRSSSATVTASLVDESVIRDVADKCLERLGERVREISDTDTSVASELIGEAIHRATLAAHAQPERSDLWDAFARLASVSDDHVLTSSAVRACPEVRLHGDYRKQASLERAVATCALNSTPVVGDDTARRAAIRRVARAAMLDPGHEESIKLVRTVVDSYRGIVRESPDADGHRAKILSSAVESFFAGDRTVESAVRDMRKDSSTPASARACASLVLGAFLREKFRVDGDSNSLKEARKVLRPDESASVAKQTAEVVAALALALEASG